MSKADSERDQAQWTMDEINRTRPRLNFPRDLDKVPQPQAEYNRQNSPRKRDVDAITADIRVNEREIVRLQAELSDAHVRDVDLRGELSETLDEIEKLARDARKQYKLEAPHVQPSQAGATVADLPGGADPGRTGADRTGTAAGASTGEHDERDQQGGRVAALPHQERGDDEIPF